MDFIGDNYYSIVVDFLKSRETIVEFVQLRRVAENIINLSILPWPCFLSELQTVRTGVVICSCLPAVKLSFTDCRLRQSKHVLRNDTLYVTANNLFFQSKVHYFHTS